MSFCVCALAPGRLGSCASLLFCFVRADGILSRFCGRLPPGPVVTPAWMPGVEWAAVPGLAVSLPVLARGNWFSVVVAMALKKMLGNDVKKLCCGSTVVRSLPGDKLALVCFKVPVSGSVDLFQSGGRIVIDFIALPSREEGNVDAIFPCSLLGYRFVRKLFRVFNTE
jgi:hypothetical protein